MAGVAILLDILQKSSNVSGRSLHSYGSFGAKAAVSAAAAASAAASFAAGRPLRSGFLFGDGGILVAYCDAGAAYAEEDIFNLQTASEKVFFPDYIKYSAKEYPVQLKPLFSAFGLKTFSLTTLRAFLTFYLPLLEPKHKIEDDDDFPFNAEEENPVDLVDPFRKSIWQKIRESTVITTRRVLERVAVHYVSQRMAWKLLKDVPGSAIRKAQRGWPSTVYIYRVSRTTFRGYLLGVAASWIVNVGIDVYLFLRAVFAENQEEEFDKTAELKLLEKRLFSITIRCGSSLIFASVGAGVGALLIRPSLGQWIGCAVGDWAGPIIVAVCFEKTLHISV